MCHMGFIGTLLMAYFVYVILLYRQQVLVVAWARVPYGSYWHSCDVLPEGRRPRGHSHNCANNSHMVTREAQATTNLLPVPGKVRLSKLPKPQPARCTLFPWIQLSVPHGIYWHTSYGVLRVCYFTLRATKCGCSIA